MSVSLDYFDCTDEKSRGRNKPKTIGFAFIQVYLAVRLLGRGYMQIDLFQGLLQIFKTRFLKYSIS